MLTGAVNDRLMRYWAYPIRRVVWRRERRSTRWGSRLERAEGATTEDQTGRCRAKGEALLNTLRRRCRSNVAESVCSTVTVGSVSPFGAAAAGGKAGTAACEGGDHDFNTIAVILLLCRLRLDEEITTTHVIGFNTETFRCALRQGTAIRSASDGMEDAMLPTR